MLQFPEFKRAEGSPELNGAGTKLIYSLGTAAQVEAMRPMLKAPGSQSALETEM